MDLKTQIHNEQTKMQAGLLNSVAGGCLSAGTITPFGLLTFGAAPTHLRLWLWVVAVAILIGMGFWLHRAALKRLEGLRE